MPKVDLNSDMGEGFGPWPMGDDAALLRIVTSANVACGFHAGDEETMRALWIAAGAGGVVAGAHVSYPDRRGFGRVETGDAVTVIVGDVGEQLRAFAAASGGAVPHVKPHGALYHRLAADAEAAAAVAELIARDHGGAAVVTLPGSALAHAAAAAGLPVLREAFADRAYGPDGGLVPRDRPGAVLDPDAAAAQALALASGGEFDTICVHGDGARAIETAEAVRRALDRR